MSAHRYHPVHAMIRRDLPASSYGFLANIDAFEDLVELADQTSREAFLVDAGDSATRAGHAEARRFQSPAEYTRERLGTPARTYEEEREALDADPSSRAPDLGPPFLELVLAGDSRLEAWVTAQADPRHRVVLASTPDALHCHTPLNQRLLRPNLDLCQWFVAGLAAVPNPPANGADPATALLAAGAFVALARVLDLSRQELLDLAAFGRRYLACYLAWEGRSDPESLRRRVHQIRNTVDREDFGDQQDRIGRAWFDSSLHHEPWFFHPESPWMQFHWFTASLGLPLSREMALAEALEAWTHNVVA